MITALAAWAFEDDPLRIEDPEKFIVDVLGSPPRIIATEAAKTISVAIGKPGAAETLQSPLKIFEGKKIETLKKVIEELVPKDFITR